MPSISSSFLSMLVLLTTLYAAGATAENGQATEKPRTTVTALDLAACKNELAEFHRLEINYIRKGVAEYCTKGDKDYSADNCKTQSKWLQDSSSTSNISWFMKGMDRCEMSEYPCFGLYIVNDGKVPDDELRALAKERPKITTELWEYASVVDNCLAKIWVAKHDGKPLNGSASGVASATTIGSRPAGSTGDSPSSAGEKALNKSNGTTDARTSAATANAKREHKIHNPAMDAKACVKLEQGTTRDGANISGNWQMSNICNFPIEFFWCEANIECSRLNGNAGNTWTISVGRGWPLSGHDFRWGACKGRDSGGFNKDSAGMSYTCPNLK